MPQMNPMNWLFLFCFFTISFMLIKSWVYFTKM